MSLISEALKKVQKERDDLQVKGAPPEPDLVSGRESKPLWKSPLVLVAVAALFLGLFAVWLTRPVSSPNISHSEPLVVETKAVPNNLPDTSGGTPAEEKQDLSREMPKAKTEDLPLVIEKSREPDPSLKADKAAEKKSSQTPRAMVKAELGEPEVSEKDELEIKLRTAETADDYVRIYQMLRRSGDEQQAFDVIKKGLVSFPEHGTLNQLALIGYVRSRNYENGLNHSEPALKADPNNPSLLTYRGLCHFHLKDYPRALADFTRSLALDQKATENIYYLALIYDSQGQYDLAIRYYRMFLDQHPENRSFRHKDYILDRLGQLSRFKQKQ